MNQDITKILDRRVEKILPSKLQLQKLLESGQKLRLYQGFDPTGGRLHLGHTIGLRQLMDFARADHEVIFLFGTGTVLVGDPSERDTGRKLITKEEIDANIQGWKDQVAPIVDFDLITIKQNGDWLIPLTLKDIIRIASHISAVQLFKRDSFTRRLKKGNTVWYHETMYPLLQGYDSVVMDVDLEIGGTDQEFNMLIGRDLQKKMNNREKFVLTVPMILGTDGGQMSKTTGNCIWLNDSPQDMYGKVMSIPDSQIQSYWQLLTDLPLNQLKELEDQPLTAKKRLAHNITHQFHGQAQASKAQTHFESTIQAKHTPQNIPLIKNSVDPTELLFSHTKHILETHKGRDYQTNGQIKRMIQQGGVEIDGQKITKPQQKLDLDPHSTQTLRYGKRLYINFEF